MKICFVSPSAGTIAGGTETIVHQLAGHLAKKHEVVVLTGRSRSQSMSQELTGGQYEILTAPYWPRFTPMNKLASKVIRRLTPYKTESYSFYYNVLLRSKVKQRLREMDVISTHYWVDSKLFSSLAFKLGVPSVFHILGGPYSREFFEADRSTLYVATNIYSQKLINEAHNINIEDVVTPGIPSRVLFQKQKKSDSKEKKLLFVGRLQESKGVYELIQIFSKLTKKHPDISLTIVGDGDIMENLKELTKELNLQKKIKFTGQVPYTKLFDYYFESTLYVFPSKSETFGIVPLEAMACGLPVVASDIPGLRESTGGRAILIPPDDMDSWVRTLDELLEDENQRNTLSAEGIEWARDFTWEKKAKEYEKALQKAVDIFRKKSGQ